MDLVSRHGSLVWADEHSKPGTTLRTAGGDVLLILGRYCYAMPLQAPKLLVWHQLDSALPGGFGYSVVRLRVFDLDQLAPIDQSVWPVPTQSGVPDPVTARTEFSTTAELCLSDIRCDLGEGRHDVALPVPFRDLDELLLLCTASQSLPMDLRLIEIHPKEGWLQVYPQDWFNEGDYDFGYQWPTRVARDPLTGRIFGEGIRLSGFVLDESNRGIEQWISD